MMLSFKQYCEEFRQFDSQVARKGNGPSVTAAADNGIMSKPAQVVGDNTSFSGNNTYLVKNTNIPFDVKIKKIKDLYNIVIKTNGDSKYILLSNTDLGKRTECTFTDRDEAIAAARDLIFRISRVDLHNI